MTTAGAVPSVTPKKSDRQGPHRVARHHRDGSGGEVDDSRPAVGEDDAEREPGDQRAAPETEQCEEKNLLHALPVSGAVAFLVNRGCWFDQFGATHPSGGGTQSPAFTIPPPSAPMYW